MRTDLILHFLAGFFLTTCFQFAGIWSVAIAVLFGISKELWDKYHDREIFDWSDLALTFGGGFIAYWVMVIYQ